MSMYRSIGTVAATATDRAMEALVGGLEIEFGRGAGEALAHQFLEAEKADFRWDARVDERWICAYESLTGCRKFRSWVSRVMRCSMRTDRGGIQGEERRRKARVLPRF